MKLAGAALKREEKMGDDRSKKGMLFLHGYFISAWVKLLNWRVTRREAALRINEVNLD